MENKFGGKFRDGNINFIVNTLGINEVDNPELYRNLKYIDNNPIKPKPYTIHMGIEAYRIFQEALKESINKNGI